MKIKYGIDDGFVGGGRSYICTVPDDDILDCETPEDAMSLIEDAIEEDFRQKVSWHFDGNRQKAVSDVMTLLNSKNAPE